MNAILKEDGRPVSDPRDSSLTAAQEFQIDPIAIGRDWDSRYTKWKRIWGDKPSPAVRTFLDNLDEVSHVLEVGFGYARDSLAICQSGHSLEGLELSSVGLTDACSQMSQYIASGRASLTIGDFTSRRIAKGSFDALFVHRVIHLLGNNGLVDAFASKAAKVVKPGGLIVISARDKRDFDETQMVERPDGMVEYKPDVPDRQGQLISLWDEARFRETFGEKFEILSLKESTEIEAINNPNKVAKFTIMTAVRKPL
jgi:SAM-dependent methyltransferase